MISMDKQYKTRDGRPVRLLCVDGPWEKFPIIGVVEGENEALSWTIDAYYSSAARAPDPRDLVEDRPKIKVERWINVNKAGGENVYLSEATAKESAEYRIKTYASEFLVIAAPFVWEEV